MSEKLGPLTFGRQHEDMIFLGRDIARDRNYSEEVAAAIDKEVKELVEGAHRRARRILEQQRDKLDLVVEALKEQETLDREAFERVISMETSGAVAAQREGPTRPNAQAAPKPKSPVRRELLDGQQPAVELE